MRSYGISCGLYEKIFSRDNFDQALAEAAKGKKGRATVLRAFVDRDSVYEAICQQRFVLGHYSRKQIQDTPSLKIRDITIPSFVYDQIWHHMVMRVLYPYLSNGFYRYNCASRPDMGPLYAYRHLRDAVYEHPDWHYFIELDVVHFYENIDHSVLKEMLARKFRDSRIVKMLSDMIDTTEKGLPLGCYYSQILANFYLSDLDHYIKEILGVAGFYRYADNMVLVDSNKRKLVNAVANIRAKLMVGFGLHTHEESENIERIAWKDAAGRIRGQRIDFVGYQICHGWSRVRKRNFKYFRRSCLRCQASLATTGRLSLSLARRMEALSGAFRHTDSFKVLRKYFFPVDKMARKTISDSAVKMSVLM